MSTTTADRIATRLQQAEAHLKVENGHDLDGVMQTFVASPRFWLNGAELEGAEAVRSVYHGLFTAFPDIVFQKKKQYVSDDGIIMELVLEGTQHAEWMGIPSSGKRMSAPLCAIMTFDDHDRLTGERVYVDFDGVMRQLTGQ